MTDQNKPDEQAVDRLLRQAADTEPVPSARLLARVMADADRVAEQRAVTRTHAADAARSGFIARLRAAIGGWPALAGLASATVAGVWIGFAAPDTLSSITDSYFLLGNSFDPGDFMPSFTDILEEG